MYEKYPEITTLRALDLITWKGHVIIVLSSTKVIESKMGNGIMVSDLTRRLKEVEEKNPRFVRFL
jgi:hypothetical protein